MSIKQDDGKIGEKDNLATLSTLKNNCFILVGEGVNGLRISQQEAGSKSKTCFDGEFGWCFFDKSDAERIAKKFSNKATRIKVISFHSEKARRKWHGTKQEKRATGLETKYFIAKRSVDDEESRIRGICDKSKFDISYLYENNSPEHFTELERKNFEFLKPQFEEWRRTQEECKAIEQELASLEKEIKEATSLPLSNPDVWPFKVLGYNNKREILLWHQGDLMSIPVKQISKKDLQLLMGPFGSEAEELIIEEAHRKGKIYDDKPIKSGVWKFKDKWLVISGKQATVIEKKRVTSLDYPVFEGKIIRFEGKDWIDWDHFSKIFGKVTISEVYNTVKSKISVWNWAAPSMADYATVFVLLSPLQHAMSWRPWLHVTGARGTGKSSLFEYILQALFGALAQKLDKSTAHAAAQSVGNTGKIPIFDEFEKNKHIPDILEMLKLSNTGGVKTSGTPGEKSFEFELHHIPWFGSIYLPKQIGQDSAQESRLVKLELKKLKDSAPLLEKIEIEESSKIAAEIVAAMIFQWDEIEQGAKNIAKRRKEIMNRIPGVQIRTVDNFMYSSSVLNIATKATNDVPEWVNTINEDDGDKIMNTILSSLLRVDLNTHTVGDCIEKANGDSSNPFAKTLENQGIKHTTNNGIRYLALRSSNVVRFILKDTDYKEMDIQAPLSRIEGAISSHPVKFLGKQERCVLVPLAFVMGEAMPNSNKRNPSVTSCVTKETTNNKRDICMSYEGYYESPDDCYKDMEKEQMSLFSEQIYENIT